MKKIEVIYDVIIADDKESYFNSQQDTAFSDYGLRLLWVETWEGAVTKLEDDFRAYDAIIIDAKGRLDKDSKPDNIQQATTAIRDLDRYKAENKYIPYAINSGYNVSELLPPYTPFFQKGNEDALFAFIRNEIENRIETKIRIEHKPIFDCFTKGYLEQRTENHVFKILRLSDIESIEGIDILDLLFNPARKVLEAIYKKLNEFDSEIIPNEAIIGPEKKVLFNPCKNRIAYGREFRDKNDIVILEKTDPFLPKHLRNILIMLHDVTSSSSHDSEEFKSTYLIKTVVNGLLEIILWYEQFIDDH